MDKIKRYISLTIPMSNCNLRCHYCYVTMHQLFGGPLPKFQYSPEHVRKALSKERWGGTCFINLCASGETLLHPQVPFYIKELLEEGHYLMVVTNATVTKNVDVIAKFPIALLERLVFKVSYHYLELKRLNMLEQFFKNIKTLRDAGCSFTLEITPNDELIPELQDAVELAVKEVGAPPHFTIARDENDPDVLPILTKLPLSEYKKIWGSYDSQLFNYKWGVFGVKRKEFCYAGDWSCFINLLDGVMGQCYRTYTQQSIFEDITTPIQFTAIGHHCIEHHCYNAHAFLTWGDIPELQAPTYAEVRNRVCLDGSEWLKPKMKAMMSSKLNESNQEYSIIKKMGCNIENVIRSKPEIRKIVKCCLNKK